MMNNLWYNNNYVLYKISRRLVGRELAFLGKPTVRGLKAHSSSFLKKHLEVYNIGRNGFMLYHSISKLENMPMFSYNFIERNKQTQDFFSNYESYVTGYDFVLDLDSPDVMVAYEEMMVIHKLFLQLEIAHEIVFSGKKGFHIEVKNLIQKNFDLKETASLFKSFAELIARTYRLETIDLSIYDNVRIWKVPYSLDTRTGYVVLPLTEFEIDNFTLEMVDPKRVLYSMSGRADFYISKGDPNNIYKLKELVAEHGK